MGHEIMNYMTTNNMCTMRIKAQSSQCPQESNSRQIQLAKCLRVNTAMTGNQWWNSLPFLPIPQNWFIYWVVSLKELSISISPPTICWPQPWLSMSAILVTVKFAHVVKFPQVEALSQSERLWPPSEPIRTDKMANLKKWQNLTVSRNGITWF